MTRDRSAGAALIAGSAAVLVIMGLHPTGHDLMSAVGRSPWPARINLFVHALAIAAAPVLLFGALGVARRLQAAPTLARLGLVTFGCAMLGVLMAALASGLLAPPLMHDLAGAAGAERDLIGAQLHLVGALNQAFANIHVAFVFAAIGLWGVAILRTGVMPAWLGWLGLALAAAVLLVQFSGNLPLDVHGFGLVMIAQTVWLAGAALALMRPAPAAVSDAAPQSRAGPTDTSASRSPR